MDFITKITGRRGSPTIVIEDTNKEVIIWTQHNKLFCTNDPQDSEDEYTYTYTYEDEEEEEEGALQEKPATPDTLVQVTDKPKNYFPNSL